MSMNKSKEDSEFRECLIDLTKKQNFYRFDTFIMREMGAALYGNKADENVRRDSFLKFRKRTHHYEFASLPTIRRWFGIGGYAVPSRKQVFYICLELQAGCEKVEEYLQYALGEIGIQYSNYQEIIYAYGLENSLGVEECLEICENFENSWSEDYQLAEKSEETRLRNEFEKNKYLDADKFVLWLCKNESWFNGFSKNVMKHLALLKREVIQYIKKESWERLESLLDETDYAVWKKKRSNQNESERDCIKKYVNNHQDVKYYKISENMKENILELSQIVFSEIETNSLLLDEIFSASRRKRKKRELSFYHDVHSMSGKHLSDLFNIPKQKKKAFYIHKAICKVNPVANDLPCPESIQTVYQKYAKTLIRVENAGQVKKWLEFYLNEQHRRCIDIHRSDLLPLIHYVASRQYLECISKKKYDYVVEDVKKLFITVGNPILRECGMAEIDVRFEIDAVLLACYQPEELFFYSDVLDVVEGKI